MKDGKNILFVQNKTHKAGAQNALYSILINDKLRGYTPILLTSGEGWLTEACRGHGIKCILRAFPNSRSLINRVAGNSVFVRAVKKEYDRLGLRPAIVHGNNYLEGLLALKLARELGAKSAITLRCSMMTRRDFHKYHCDRFDLILAIGNELYTKALKWSSGNRVVFINDGLYGSEFSPQKEKPREFPGRVLVIGNTQAGKGWSDLSRALYLLSRKAALPKLELDFIGDIPSPKMQADELKIDLLKGISFNFMGRVEEIKELIGGYHLAINPSRSESFGRAALEVLAAGVPLISSRTGAVKEVITDNRLLFNPGDPHDMAKVLEYVIMNWKDLDLDIPECQRRIKTKFNIDSTVGFLVQKYDELMA